MRAQRLERRARSRPPRAGPRRRDASRAARPSPGSSRCRLAVWNEPDADDPAHGAGGRGRQVGLGALDAGEQRLGVGDEHERGIGEPQPAPRGLEQRRARLALQHAELLRHRRRAVRQRLRHRADRPAAVQLVQQAKPAEVEHRSTSSHGTVRKRPLLSMGRGRMMRACAAPFSASSPQPPSARSGSSASSPRTPARASPARCWCASRSRPPCSRCSCGRPAAGPRCGGCRAAWCSPGSGSAPSATASSRGCSSSPSGGSTWRSSRCCSTRTRRS